MAYLAVQSWGDEVMFHNCPTRKENKYWQDDEVYWEIRGLTTCAQDYSIVLPKGTIKNLIGRDMTWEDEPVLLSADVESNGEWKVGDVGYFFNEFLWKTMKVKIESVNEDWLMVIDDYGYTFRLAKDYCYRTEEECEMSL